MTRSKLGNLHPYDPEIDRTFHRLSRSNRSRRVVVYDSVVVHDRVVLDSSVVHTEFLAESISYFVF